MNEEWKFEPDPFTRDYINYLDKSPVKFDKLNQQIELIRKEVEEKLKNFHLVSDYKEQLTYLFEQLKDYDFCQENSLIDVTGIKKNILVKWQPSNIKLLHPLKMVEEEFLVSER